MDAKTIHSIYMYYCNFSSSDRTLLPSFLCMNEMFYEMIKETFRHNVNMKRPDSF